MSETKINKLAKFIEIFDEMSADLNLGRLSNSEKDVLLSLARQYSKNNNSEINIKISILLIIKVTQLLNQHFIKF
jgi:hypothetical protein